MLKFALAVGLVWLTLTGVASAQYEGLEAAARSAVVGRAEARFVNVDGHEFHIRPPTIRRSRVDGMMVAQLSGRLSHHLSGRTDDQYYYRMTVTADGVLTEFSERINRGGLASMVNALAGRTSHGTRFRTINVLSQGPNLVVDAIGYELGRRIDGNWEGAARTAAVAVAAQAATTLQPRRRDMRGTRAESETSRRRDARTPSRTTVATTDSGGGQPTSPDHTAASSQLPR